jgi:hypothetical protein
MTTPKTELLPCPFCGGTPVVIDDDCGWHVQCQNANCKVEVDTYHSGKHIAVRWWNTRADTRADRLDALLGEVLACLRTNMLRETIITENNSELERWIDDWQKRRAEA